MKRISLKASARLAGVLAVSTSMLTLGNLASTSHVAGADPAFVTSYVGVGSDTIQDVFDAYSGGNPSPGATSAQPVNFFTPIHSSQASRSKTVSSFDAVDANGAVGCVTTKLGGPSFDRPNGSTDGINALSNAVNGGSWQKAAACAGTPGNVNGQIDFARSSRDHNAVAGTQLTYIPFARDAVSYAYFDHNTQVASALTKAQLTALYTSPTGSITVGANTIKACITQQGSGTTKFWETAIGVTDAQAQAASAASGCTTNPSTLEENGGNSFYTFASTLLVKVRST